MTVRLDSFTPESFQDLVAALVAAECGGRAQKMGRGPDGGRDMILRLPDGESWGGYTVFQAKFKAERGGSTTWMVQQLKGEIDRWVDDSTGRKELPRRLVFLTNVVLTPAPVRGGFDRLTAFPIEYLELRRSKLSESSKDSSERARIDALLRAEWVFWDGVQIATLIDAHQGVRNAFPALLTAGDALASLQHAFDIVGAESMGAALQSHARTTLVGEGFVYFDEAGSADGNGYPLNEVIVDLPLAGRSSTLLAHVKSRAEHMLRPAVTTVDGPRHILIAGAPGNGKTTVSKFLVQAFRAAYLRGSAELSSDHDQLIKQIDHSFTRMGMKAPAHRRWPLRVDLGLFAEEGADETLLQWAAAQVSKRVDHGRVTASQLNGWLRQWPSLLVLDGLDEVTEPTVRKSTIERIVELVNEAEAENLDILVVVTTRPMGYTENIAPTQFERVDLGYLEPVEALEYGTNAARVRIGRDPERFERVVSRMKAAANDPQRTHLLRTPLQVLILSIILDGQNHLDTDRYGLFWGYYKTILKREREKPGPIGTLLREHDLLVESLHEHVGFELHVRCELPESPNATVDDDDLRAIAWSVMELHGLDPRRAHAYLLDRILQAVTHRLVLLAPQEGHDGYGFDVRSLQELMAARCITNVSDSAIESNLRLIAASPHWRNSWLFAAGRTFGESKHAARDGLVRLIETVDVGAAGRLGACVPVAPWLAIDILDDGMGRNLPRWRDPIADVALSSLRIPHHALSAVTLQPLLTIADSNEELRQRFVTAFRDALGGEPIERQNAERIQAQLAELARRHQLTPTGLALHAVRPSGQALFLAPDAWNAFTEWSSALADDVDQATLFRSIEIVATARHRHLTEHERAELASHISDGAVAAGVDDLCADVSLQYSTVSTQLRACLEEYVYRRPIGRQLITDLTSHLPGAGGGST